MRVPRKLKLVLAAALAIAIAGILAIWILRPAIETRLIGIHQRSVARSLAKWALEDSNITNDASAIHAAEMVGYIKDYYVPGEGYRGPAEVEAELEKQRQRAIGLLGASLERYTGLAYGTNVERWTEWARQRKDLGGPPKSTEAGGQPIGTHTNSTSSAAESHL